MTHRRVIIIRNAAASDFGGGERFPVFLAEALKGSDYEPYIISGSKRLLDFAASRQISHQRGWWWSRQQWSGRASLLFPFYCIWQCILTVYYLCVFIKLRPVVVHPQGKDDFIAATIAARLIGARVIWTDHADLKHIWLNLSIWYKNPIGKLIYYVATLASAITVVSKSELALITKHLPARAHIRKRLVVVYNGVVDSSAEHPLTLQKDGIVRFISASRLVTDKGIGELIDAFLALHTRHPQTELVLAGDGPDEAQFHTQAGNHPAIIFRGYVTNPLEAISAADIYVHPTYHEGFSVALVEASMLEKPIIATSVGGNTEIISNEKTGLLVPAKHPEALEKAMERLLKDAAFRKQLGSNARVQFLSNFEFNHIVHSQFIPLYKGDHV